jgi:isocitrate dehydrogenase
VRFRDYENNFSISKTPRTDKKLEGVDVFIDWPEDDRQPEKIASAWRRLPRDTNSRLKMITNRGCNVYPGGLPETFWTDHWRCRFISRDGGEVDFSDILKIQNAIASGGFDIIKTENLYQFEGERGYSLGQGE